MGTILPVKCCSIAGHSKERFDETVRACVEVRSTCNTTVTYHVQVVTLNSSIMQSAFWPTRCEDLHNSATNQAPAVAGEDY